MKNLFPLLLLLFALGFTSCKSKKAKNERLQTEKTQKFTHTAFEAYVTHNSELHFTPAEEVPWAGYMAGNEEHKVWGYYHLAGRQRTLTEPHIRMETFPNSFQGAETEANLFDWLKSLFVDSEREGKLITDSEEITTADGVTVHLLEIHTPAKTLMRGDDEINHIDKQMAWVYVPQGDNWLALNASAHDTTAFKALRAAFVRLVESIHTESLN